MFQKVVCSVHNLKGKTVEKLQEDIFHETFDVKVLNGADTPSAPFLMKEHFSALVYQLNWNTLNGVIEHARGNDL